MGGITSEWHTLRLDRHGHVATLTLDRANRHNAQTPEMWDELGAAGKLLLADSTLRCLVVRGAGASFSSGIDLGYLDSVANPSNPLRSGDRETVVGNLRLIQAAFGWFKSAGFISIAAVHGVAFGAGCELALACDLRIVAEDALFSLPEVSFGLIPDLGSTLWLPRLVGPSRALAMMLDGRVVSAREAVEIGLADQLAEDLDGQVAANVRRWSALEPAAVAATKRAIADGYAKQEASLAAVASAQADLLAARFSNQIAKT
jgi:enoyl-CoA hydratase/carnithine racemase